MSPVDRAWLEMDGPGNPMVVAGVFQIERPYRLAAIRKTCTQRLLEYRRFRQHPAPECEPTCWVDAGPLNLDYHVQVRRLADSSDETLRVAIGSELTGELDRSLPMWRLLFFPRRGRALTVLFRAHHALADGMALVQVLLNITGARSGRRSAGPAGTAGGQRRDGPLGSLIRRLQAIDRRLAGLRAMALDDLHHPDHLLEQLRHGRELLRAATRVLRLPDDNPPTLHRPLSGRRRVGWLDDLPFAPIRGAARRLGVTVNDLFLTALAGGMTGALNAGGSTVPAGQNLRAAVPVDLRGGFNDELGNCFGLVLAELPVGPMDPRQRLRTVARRMLALKRSPEAEAVLVVLAAAGHLPVPLEKKLVAMIGSKAVAVVSNLPGPSRARTIAGARLKSVVFWPPQAGGVGMGISLFSYAAKVSVGVSVDPILGIDPQALLDAFRAELDALRRLSRRRAQRAVRRPSRSRGARA